MILRGRDSTKWVRIYATLFDLHKLILVPVEADVKSRPIKFLSLLLAAGEADATYHWFQ